MPAIENVLIERNYQFQYQYQTFTQTTRLVERGNNDRNYWDEPEDPMHWTLEVTISHTTARTRPSTGQTIETQRGFLPSLESFVTVAGAGAVAYGSVRSLPSSIRAHVKRNLNYSISAAWNLRSTAEPVEGQEMQARFRANWRYRGGGRESNMTEDVATRAALVLSEYLSQSWHCPNELNGCSYVHIEAAVHHQPNDPSNPREIDPTRWVPEQFLDGFYWYQRSIHSDDVERFRFVTVTNHGRPSTRADQLAGMRAVLQTCSYCTNVFLTERMVGNTGYVDGQMVPVPVGGQAYCIDCFNADVVEECERCSAWGYTGDFSEVEDYDEEEESYYDARVCARCSRSRQSDVNLRLNLLNYSHKPDPIFHYLPEGGDRLFMGMELEVARTDTQNNAKVNRWIASLDPTMFYVKGDSSVRNGMEVVTHPFTYPWARENFPYQKFDELLEISNVIPDHESAGTHIHISKDAFDPTHMWKFLLLVLENHSFFGTLGGRGDANSYGSLIGADAERIRTNLMELAKQKGNVNILASQGVYFGRGGVNLTNEHTIELRFLAGNVTPEGIKKNQQLVKAAFDFSNMVRAGDALKGALGDPGYFLHYVNNETDFTELSEFMSKSFPIPKPLRSN